ncbi:hypothetical protein M8818_005173 [Zalaria obscura]|uniref:Uncharacterized protein n=1 Tax=Zalaria obscura TaxID=2024903 RepID=A0ACC3SA60_9PEZI
MASAALRVLSIVELLEAILLHIVTPPSPVEDIDDPRCASVATHSSSLLTLLSMSRVSHFWKSTIDQSQAIQRALFLTPDTASGSWNASEGGARPVLNPILQARFRNYQFRFLPPHIPMEQLDHRHSAYLVITRADADAWPQKRCPNVLDRMLLAQPPMERVAAVIWERSTAMRTTVPVTNKFFGMRIIDPNRPNGLTLGFLHQTIQEQLAEDVTINAIKLITP